MNLLSFFLFGYSYTDIIDYRLKSLIKKHNGTGHIRRPRPSIVGVQLTIGALLLTICCFFAQVDLFWSSMAVLATGLAVFGTVSEYEYHRAIWKAHVQKLPTIIGVSRIMEDSPYPCFKVSHRPDGSPNEDLQFALWPNHREFPRMYTLAVVGAPILLVKATHCDTPLWVPLSKFYIGHLRLNFQKKDRDILPSAWCDLLERNLDSVPMNAKFELI